MCVCVCVYYIFFIHSSVDGHLGCLCVLALYTMLPDTFSNLCSMLIYFLFSWLLQVSPLIQDLGRAQFCS